jgi:hypothetical protein
LYFYYKTMLFCSQGFTLKNMYCNNLACFWGCSYLPKSLIYEDLIHMYYSVWLVHFLSSSYQYVYIIVPSLYLNNYIKIYFLWSRLIIDKCIHSEGQPTWNKVQLQIKLYYIRKQWVTSSNWDLAYLKLS